MKKNFLIGLDGGYSKTMGVLLDHTGKILAECSDKGSAVINKPSKEASMVLSNIVDCLCSNSRLERKDIKHVGIGLNGIDFKDEFEMQLSEIGSHIGMPIKKIKLTNDGIPALWGATNRKKAIILQFGSGFTSAYRNSHGGEQLFDHLNVGRIFDIRRETISMVERMTDGRKEPTLLKEEVLNYLGVPENNYAEYVFKNRTLGTKPFGISSIVFKSWLNQDIAAQELVDKMIDDCILVVKAIIKRIGEGGIDICFGGGVLKPAPKKIWSYMEQIFDKEFLNIKVKYPLMPPEYGAAIMAADACGHDPISLFNKLLQEYKD